MKIIIWGHPLHKSTHSYIHNAYYKAFKHLGHEVYWVPEHVDNMSFNDEVVFFVEDSQKQGMPLLKNAKYITHHVDTSYLTNNGVPFENVLKLGNYIELIENFEKITDQVYWDKDTRTIYQCWGTDLLPHEINTDDYVRFDPNAKDLNYVAMLYDELPWWANQFANLIKQNHNVDFKVYTQHVSDSDNRSLIRKSFLCPDFRNDWHLQCGYIPCRIFKNISYGRIQGTNSPFVKRMFGDHVVFGGTPQTLYNNLLQAEKHNKIDMKNAMQFVKDKHTYVNRVKMLLKFL